MKNNRHVQNQIKWVIALLICITFIMPAARVEAAKPKLSRKEVTMTRGQAITLQVKKASGKKVKWSVSNKKVLSIKKNSKTKYTVTAKAKGKASVICKVGKKKLKCAITVNERKPVYSGFPEYDYLMTLIAKDAKLKDSMDDETLMYTLFKWMAKKCVYTYEAKKKYGVDVLKQFYFLDGKEKEISDFKAACDAKVARGEASYNDGVHIKYEGWSDYVLDCFCRRTGTCSYFASVYALILEQYGLNVGLVEGSIRNSKNEFVEQTINWVVIDGKKYMIDVGSAIHQYTRKKNFRKDFYKLSKQALKRNYKLDVAWW